MESAILGHTHHIYDGQKTFVISCLTVSHRMEQHLELLAITANTTQAAHCCLDTILLIFGSLFACY